jgi:hypothetical protein
VRAFAAVCAQAHLDHLASEHIGQEQWIKYTFLTALAAHLPAARDIGTIVATDDGEAIVRGLYDECLAVAEAAGEPIPVAAQDTARGTLTQAGSALKASMLRDLEAGQQVEAEQIVGDMLARARKADQEALLLQVAYSSLQAYQALRRREHHLRRQCIALAGADPRAGLEWRCDGPTSAGIGRTRRRHGTRSRIGATRAIAVPSAGCRCPALLDEIAQAEAVLCSVPPDADGDPALRLLLPALQASPACAGSAICRRPRCMPTGPAAGSTTSAADATEAAGVQRRLAKRNGVRLRTRHRVGGVPPARPVRAGAQCAAAAGAGTCPPRGAPWPGVQPAARAGPGGGDHRGDAAPARRACTCPPMTSRHRRRTCWPSPRSWAGLRCHLPWHGTTLR